MNETASARDVWTAAQCRASRRLFECCGAAGATTQTPAFAIALTEAAGQFAWHAQLYDELLPHRVDIDRDALVAVHVVGDDELLALLASTLASNEASACALLIDVVLPHLAAGVHRAQSETSSVLDGPRTRALTLVGRDLSDLASRFSELSRRASWSEGTNDAAEVLDRARRALESARSGQ